MVYAFPSLPDPIKLVLWILQSCTNNYPCCNAASHWIRVTDKKTKHVVGAALWKLNQSGYTAGDGERFKTSFKATQHVEGSEKRLFAEKLIGGLRGAALETIKGPHIGENMVGSVIHHSNFIRVEANGCISGA
jgi:hypothetical protein